MNSPLLFLLLSSCLWLTFAEQIYPFATEETIVHSEERVFVEFQKPLHPPAGWWAENRMVRKDTEITLVWALKQQNLDQLEAIFWDVSNPRSKNYGKHLTLFEIADLVAPEKEDIVHVMDFISSYSPISTHLTLSRDFIVSKFTVEKAEELLQVKFSYFYHPFTNIRLLRSLEPYTLPSCVAARVDFVGGVHRFPAHRVLREFALSDSNAGGVTPASIRERYNVTDVGSSSKNSMATSQFLRQWYSPDDLSQFFADNDLPDYKVAKVVGDNREDKPGVEAMLDIEYIMGVGQNVTTWFYFTSGYDNVGQEPFLEWIVALNDDPSTPWVNSVSYGDEEDSISDDYIDRCNTEFQKFGTSGHSILFASGDSGVGCVDGTSFRPEWPTQSPYVTSVGGTFMVGSTETAVEFSGGGFSNHFTQPSYQKDAVADFFATSQDLPPSSYYNSTSRAYPDIAAFATNYQVVVNGRTTGVGGTSASTPTVSGIISLLNDVRIQNGKSSLGFLNPFLYQTLASSPEAFYDVATGSNPSGQCPGFTATDGWDPVTGVGSPNYAILKKLVLEN